MNPKRTVRYYYLKFLRLKGDPRSLAWGTAMGTFLGIIPITPFHTISVLVVTFLTRTSTIAALLATFLTCNPVTYVPQYYFSTIIGNYFTPYELSWDRIKNVLDILMAKPGFTESLAALSSLGYEAVIVLLVGGCILALPFAVISYFLSLKFFIAIREKRREKQLLQNL